MTELTVKIVEIPNGYRFIRSDGECFFLIIFGNGGDAKLFHGDDPDTPPTISIIEIGASFSNKVERARLHVLAYPNQLDDYDIKAEFPVI